MILIKFPDIGCKEKRNPTIGLVPQYNGSMNRFLLKKVHKKGRIREDAAIIYKRPKKGVFQKCAALPHAGPNLIEL
jgi:hypothetical protein